MKLPNIVDTPPLLQLVQWITDPLGYMDANVERYGDIFTARLGKSKTIVFASNPQAIQEIFSADPQQFDTGRVNQTIRPLVGDESVFLIDGERHRRERQLLMPPFHGERMRTYNQLIRNITEQVTSRWSVGQTFSARDVMQEITLRVILHAVFGLDEGERSRQLQHRLGQLMDMTSSPLKSSMLFFPFLQKDLGAWSPWGQFLRRQEKMNELLYAEIRERRENLDPSRTDVLTLLLLARDEAGEGMSDLELRDELITVLAAGHETTATALAWALYWVHRQPQVRERLIEELDNAGGNPDPTAFFRLPYLSAVCQETLRIYPVTVITFARVVNSPFQLMGYELEPETQLTCCIYLTHQRPELYPEPKQFKPERFLNRQFSPYEYLPFGGGSRRCLGLALAQFEMKLVLATVLSQWQLALADSQPVKPARRGLTLAPADGVRMTVTGQRLRQASLM
ncbi:cytochrome P450 [Microcoleus sp. FACHB-68]|uniref:cytochrome P450 n=1 Tax=Microcoleus sp. FACHB-68 TaxID=2692826 RepID=UPI001686E765|nr:cytochrome P450 [Microcoleus sp. FACHB-68]MBD1936252.1 cytochrome P450 [Microcoleus sp. FACHB-68]